VRDKKKSCKSCSSVDKKRFPRLPLPSFPVPKEIKPSLKAAFDPEWRNKRICEGEYEGGKFEV